jgi:hypothetical protein
VFPLGFVPGSASFPAQLCFGPALFRAAFSPRDRER